jgi:hypothetical protein
MLRTFQDAHGWQQQGTELFGRAASSLDEAGLAEPSGLPGWRRKNLALGGDRRGDTDVRLVPGASSHHRERQQAPVRRTALVFTDSLRSLAVTEHVKSAIRADHRLSDAQQAALIAVYDSMLRD